MPRTASQPNMVMVSSSSTSDTSSSNNNHSTYGSHSSYHSIYNAGGYSSSTTALSGLAAAATTAATTYGSYSNSINSSNSRITGGGQRQSASYCNLAMSSDSTPTSASRSRRTGTSPVPTSSTTTTTAARSTSPSTTSHNHPITNANENTGAATTTAVVRQQHSFSTAVLPSSASSANASSASSSLSMSSSFVRKAPGKSSSFKTTRLRYPLPGVASDGNNNQGDPVMVFHQDHNNSNSSGNNGGNQSGHDSPLRLPRRQPFRAAEGGRGDVLPTTTPTIDSAGSLEGVGMTMQWNRARASSNDTWTEGAGGGTGAPAATTTSTSMSSQSLRIRPHRKSRDYPLNGGGGVGGSHSFLLDDDLSGLESNGRFPRNDYFVQHSTISNSFSKRGHGKHGNSSSINNNSMLGGGDGGALWSSPTVWGFVVKVTKGRSLLQWIMVGTILLLVADTYARITTTTDKLEQFRQDESLLMMHLRRLEQQSIQLHENLSRLAETGRIGSPPSASNASNNNNNGALSGTGNNNAVVDNSMESNNLADVAGTDSAVDAKLIKVQTQQLRQMEEELNHELRSLQLKLQQDARSRIIDAFGEGPVQIVLELDFPPTAETAGLASNGVTPRISILLWYDTPHAAWTLINQVRNGIWTGATFAMGKDFSITATPHPNNNNINANAAVNSRIDFVEQSSQTHKPWTVGLTEIDHHATAGGSENTDNNHGGQMSLFINLQDNADLHKDDVCVGKIIEGFDALQRLLDVSRSSHQGPVRIRAATASHLTRSQTGLVK